MLTYPQLVQTKAIHRQIGDHVRELISSGKLAPETKLPATEELAASWRTNPKTIQNALTPLVKEGLLTRVPKRGTFVRKREEKLICVGVYGACGVTGTTVSSYTHALRQALRDELHKDGIEMDLWMDSRPGDPTAELWNLRSKIGPWNPLVKAAEQRQFQAFIATDTDLSLLEWQRKLPVPAAFLGGPPSMPNVVDHDMRQFVEISLRELARQGCRSVGLIAPIVAAPHPESFMRPVGWFDVLEHFTDVARDLGLTVKNSWMQAMRDEVEWTQGHERFGYEKFLKLWSQPEKPEGLLIFDDFVARGALMAIQEKQVRVPDELKLALHKNENVDLFCPMPATFVVSSEREMARALIEQVQKQFRGESCERISLPFKLATHTNL